MPIYEFENVRTGKRVELFQPVSRRNCAPPGFRRVVSRLGVVFQPMADPGSAPVAVPRALKQLEATMPAEQIAREAGFSPKKLKKVWKI